MADVKFTKSDKLYSVDDGQKRGPLTTARLRFHSAGRHLVGQCADRRLALWDLEAEVEKTKKGMSVVGKLVCPHESGWVRGFDLHPHGKWVVTGGSDRRLKFWKWDGVPAESPTHDIEAHNGWIEAVAFSPDGERVATVGSDRLLKLWNVADGKHVHTAQAHTNYPRDVAFTPNGKWIVTGGEDGAGIVWAADSLELVRTIDTLTAGDQQGQNPALSGIIRVSISHDGRLLAVAGDRQTEVFELETGHSVGAINQGGVEALFGRQTNVLAVGSDSLRVVAFEPEKLAPKPIEMKVDPKGKMSRNNPIAFPCRELAQIKRGEFSLGAAFATDDKRLAVGRTDGAVEMWELT